MRRYLLLCLLLLPLFASPQQTRIEEQTITHTQAQQWGLTDSEWQHYQQLRQGERGIWSPGLDPLTTLGVETNSDAERQRYAELLARKEHQRVEKELAFQRAYDQAWKRLYPTLTPIRSVVQPRLALFVSEKCRPARRWRRSLSTMTAHWISGWSTTATTMPACNAGRSASILICARSNAGR